MVPRYDQITLNLADRHNNLQQIISPNENEEGVWIHQNAWFHLAKFDQYFTSVYTMKDPSNGLYIFNLSGQVQINEQILHPRDGYGIWETNNINIKAITESEFLIMEVPMKIS